MQITALDIYTSAIIVDSAVTLGVGFWLNRTAKNQVKAAVNDIGPAIQRELKGAAEEYAKEAKRDIAQAIQKLIPIILKAIKNNARRTDTIRDDSFISDIEPVRNKSTTDTSREYSDNS
jgi:hypothetical protein